MSETEKTRKVMSETKTVRETVAEPHRRADAKAQKYVRSKWLFAEYKGIAVAYETVLKLIDAECNVAALAAAHPAKVKEKK